MDPALGVLDTQSLTMLRRALDRLAAGFAGLPPSGTQLEDAAGLERVLNLPPPRIDLLMAPHHGSRTANTPGFAEWTRPRVVVSCQGPPRGLLRQPEPYTAIGATFLGTWPDGAVTVRSSRDALMVETYRSGRRLAMKRSE